VNVEVKWICAVALGMTVTGAASRSIERTPFAMKAVERFIVRFSYDVTNKPSGRRFQLDETGLFTIENGKIVREEFFYGMG
jgi:hypothetical protein